MPMVYDHRSWLHLSVTTPGEGKKKHVNSANFFLHPFLLTSSLPRIKKGAAPPQYVCDLCNRNFSTQGSLNRHRESVHRQSDGFSCQVCGQRFCRKDHLARHRKVHRPAVEVWRDLLDVSADASVDPPPPAPFPLPSPLPPPSPVPPPPKSHSERPVCDLCAKSFASQKTLKRHRQVVHRQLGGFLCLNTKGNFFS